jgi:hypothetical protein
MNRPQIKSPNGPIINIFSNQFQDLLDQGYTVDDLLGISMTQLPVLPTSPNIPFTGLPDIDLNILNQLNDFNKIKEACRVNKYTLVLCQSNYFWLTKIQNGNLFIPITSQYSRY